MISSIASAAAILAQKEVVAWLPCCLIPAAILALVVASVFTY